MFKFLCARVSVRSGGRGDFNELCANLNFEKLKISYWIKIITSWSCQHCSLHTPNVYFDCVLHPYKDMWQLLTWRPPFPIISTFVLICWKCTTYKTVKLKIVRAQSQIISVYICHKCNNKANALNFKPFTNKMKKIVKQNHKKNCIHLCRPRISGE